MTIRVLAQKSSNGHSLPEGCGCGGKLYIEKLDSRVSCVWRASWAVATNGVVGDQGGGIPSTEREAPCGGKVLIRPNRDSL